MFMFLSRLGKLTFIALTTVAYLRFPKPQKLNNDKRCSELGFDVYSYTPVLLRKEVIQDVYKRQTKRCKKCLRT